VKRCLAPLVTAVAIGCAGAPPPPSSPPPEPVVGYTYRDLAQQAAPPGRPGADLLHAGEVAADLDLLEYALETGYGGRRFVSALAWVAMRAKLEADRGGSFTVEDFCHDVGDALAELPDAHLLARQREESGKVVAVCGSRVSAERRTPSVGKPYAAGEKDRPWAADFLAVGHATLAVLAIHHFPSHEDPAWGGYDGILEELQRADGIVVDLRGNGGGDDSRGLQLARALTDAPPAFQFLRTHERRTPEALTLQLNGVDRSARGEGGVLAPWAAARYEAATRDRDEAAAHPEEDRVRDAPAWTQPGPKAFHGPVAVLVDSGCASSCETTLQALRRHPGARVFGERTGGNVNFGEVGSLILPNSRVEVSIPTKYFQFPEDRLVDKIGFDPDVAVPPKQDAFEAATAWLVGGEPKARVVPPAAYEVPQASRAGDAERLKKLGLDVPEGGVVLEKPWAEPLGRRSFVVPGGWLPRKVPRVVFAPALLADLDALESVMRRAYGGYERARKRGWAWDAWFAAWRKDLAAAGARWLPMKEAFAPVERFERFQLDNHTTIPLGLRFGSGSRVYRLVEAEAAPAAARKGQGGKGACDLARDDQGREIALDVADAAQQPRSTDRFDGRVLGRARWIAAPAMRGTLTGIRCAGAWIPLAAVPQPAPEDRLAQVNELSGQPEDRPALRHAGDTIAVLRLPTFSKQNGEIVVRERASWDRPTGKEKALVVDLRGNGGGDAAFGALEGWIAKDDLERIQSFGRRKGASCLYPALRWGYTSISSWSLAPPISDEMRKGLSWSLGQLFQKDDPACPAKFEVERAKRHYGDARSPKPRALEPRVVVLVDGGCGSDCEYMAQALAGLPEAVVVGLNTYGVAEYIQPGYSVLPNTRLPYRIALGTSEVYGDGRSLDGYGLDVDVLVDGKDAWTKEALVRLVDALALDGGRVRP
jgi:C-terminal processing protease CtpA/Prc